MLSVLFVVCRDDDTNRDGDVGQLSDIASSYARDFHFYRWPRDIPSATTEIRMCTKVYVRNLRIRTLTIQNDSILEHNQPTRKPG